MVDYSIMLKKIKNLLELKINIFLLDQLYLFVPNIILEESVNTKKGLYFDIYIIIVEIYVKILKNIHNKDDDFIKLLRETRLKSILKVANRTVWWKNYFYKNKIDITKGGGALRYIPPVSKQSLVSIDKKDLLSVEDKNKRIVWRYSGGSTTGVSFYWAHDKALMRVSILAEFICELEKFGFNFKKNSSDNFYMQFNFAQRPHVASFTLFFKGDYILTDTRIPDFENQLKKIASQLTENTILRIAPMGLIFLVEELRKINIRPKISFCLVVGSSLDENIRKTAEEYLQCVVITHYGTQESAPISIECHDHKGFYHIFEERAIVEILDDNGKQNNEIGNITITCLDNVIMPMIRYQPGDRGVIHYNKSCECGNNSPLLEIKNRTTDIIKLNEDKYGQVQEIIKEFYKEPFIHIIRKFQIKQEKIGQIEITLEIRTENTAQEILKLKKIIENIYDYPLEVIFKETSHIVQDTHKFRLFIPMQTTK